MKGLTKELKQKSIDKWEEVILNIKKRNEICYFNKYYTTCGFCEARRNAGCSICYLDKVDVCSTRVEEDNVRKALKRADEFRWNEALENAEIVLAAIMDAKIDKEAKEV